MVAATALTCYLGHTISGDFNSSLAMPPVIVAVLGGLR